MGLAIESFCSLSDFLLFWKFDSSRDLNEPASKELEDLISPQRGERTGDGRACGARYLSPLWKYPHLAFPSAISRPTLPSPGEAYSQSSHTDHPPVYILFFFFETTAKGISSFPAQRKVYHPPGFCCPPTINHPLCSQAPQIVPKSSSKV